MNSWRRKGKRNYAQQTYYTWSRENENGNDDEFINALFQTIRIDTSLGKPDPNKSRPIKLKMKDESENNNFMAKLHNLKNAEDRFSKITITEEYTPEERDAIRNKVNRIQE